MSENTSQAFVKLNEKTLFENVNEKQVLTQITSYEFNTQNWVKRNVEIFQKKTKFKKWVGEVVVKSYITLSPDEFAKILALGTKS